jgi:hypothetical protein
VLIIISDRIYKIFFLKFFRPNEDGIYSPIVKSSSMKMEHIVLL